MDKKGRNAIHYYLMGVLGFIAASSTSYAMAVADKDDVKEIARLYSAAFDRHPAVGTPKGLNFWVESFEGGRTVTSIANDFYESPEFTGKYGQLSNRAYVEQLFRNVLGREGAQKGIGIFTDHLDAGRMSRAAVLKSFANSPEDIHKTESVFGTFLKSPDGNWDFDINMNGVGDSREPDEPQYKEVLFAELKADIDGVSQPLQWVAASGGLRPAGAIQSPASESGYPFYICRALVDDDLLPGKIRTPFQGCNVTGAGPEQQVSDYEVLVGDARRIAWSDDQITRDAVVAGHLGNYSLFACLAEAYGTQHPGNVIAGENKCHFGYGGEHDSSTDFKVLRAAAWIASSDRTNYDNARPVGHYLPNKNPNEVVDTFICRSVDENHSMVGRVTDNSDGVHCYVSVGQGSNVWEISIDDFEVLSDWDTAWVGQDEVATTVWDAQVQALVSLPDLIAELGDDADLFVGGISSEAEIARATRLAAMNRMNAMRLGYDDAGLPIFSCRTYAFSNGWWPGRYTIDGDFCRIGSYASKAFDILSKEEPHELD